MIHYNPDYIVGVVRGGIIPARMLAKLLDVGSMFCLNVEKENGERMVRSNVDFSLKDKKILLVEDMLETGKSMMVARKWLEERGAEVKTACLYIMPDSEYEADFYLKEVVKVVQFPWD